MPQKPKSIMHLECYSEEGEVQKGVACLSDTQSIQLTTKPSEPIDPDPDVAAVFDTGHLSAFTFGFFLMVLDQ